MDKHKYIFLVIALVIGLAVYGFSVTSGDEITITSDSTSTNKDSQVKADEPPIVDKPSYSIDKVDSIWLVVNKSRPISLDYVPKDLRKVAIAGRAGKSDAELSLRDEVATAAETMVKVARKDQIYLILGSGYRDSTLQNYYYTNYVSAYGQAEADKFSAKPGTSEHQTGLSADLAPASLNCYLEICFAETDEGIWLANHANEYGFIIRYPNGKESITGYQFEPWHVRYLGIDLATQIYNNAETLEEHFNLVGA